MNNYDPWKDNKPVFQTNEEPAKSFLYVEPEDLIEDKVNNPEEIPQRIYYPLSEAVKQFTGFTKNGLIGFMIKNEFIFTDGSLCFGWNMNDHAKITEIDYNKYKIELSQEAIDDLITYYNENGYSPYRTNFE